MVDQNCPKCRGTGRVREADGSIHTCFDCLQKGEMDQHDKRTKSAEELGIKL
ncbi:hypothetical protein HYT23_05610 [Candidatus Pacearchaeota archaeon]|nr:hypothetical protein [Candidatus Pacearchaeota archaeon]